MAVHNGTRMRNAAVMALLLVAIVCGACKAVANAPAADTAKPAVSSSPRWLVAGCDISGSYHNADPCLDMVLSIIQNELRGGDRLFLRMIGRDSYLDGYDVLSLAIPDAPVSHNPWDPKERARLAAYQQEVWALKGRAVARIREAKTYGFKRLPVDATGMTDVYGFLAKAGELMDKAPSTVRRVILICSDLIDNRNQAALSIRIAPASVVVALFESSRGSAGEIQKRKSEWTRSFTAFGAAAVVYLDPAEGIGGNGGLLESASTR